MSEEFNLEEVKKEIQSPCKLENTSKYLLGLPILGEIVKKAFIENLKGETDDVKIRAIKSSNSKRYNC
ncbi:MAG: hypothetical protein KatS3mg068_1906 [Candidatus Sericytochromatia bacterium]|nr:MAG: hypothetical protein KatS3mg068_1906 [Candidatus Sericytochromatia bacterium]